MTNPTPKKQAARSYVMEFQAEPSPYHRGTRFHWMISTAQRPDELVSWGYADSQESAELAARQELQNLDEGLTQGGRVTRTRKVSLHRY